VERSGIKTVVFCRRSTYKFSMCFDHCLPFHGNLKNPSITRFSARTIHLRRQFRPACSGVDKRWHAAYRSTHPGVCCWPCDAGLWVCRADRQKRSPKTPFWHSGSGPFRNSKLVRRAEGEAASPEDDLQAEIEKLYKHVRDEFAPLAFLYDLRVHGGLAHHPNIKEAAKAAKALGLPASGWLRRQAVPGQSHPRTYPGCLGRHVPNEPANRPIRNQRRLTNV
jgi:hypothetical protein